MSTFKSKSDYFGLGSITGLQVKTSTENKGQSVAEAKGENGFVVATQPFGITATPSLDISINADVTLSGITLGTITELNNKSYALSGISISTSAGEWPTMTATGMLVEDDATANCTAVLPATAVEAIAHAQLFGAFTMTGTGCHVTSCSFEASSTIATATVEGEVVAHDLTDARLTVTATIQSSDSTYAVPTITASTGWVVTSPLTETNPDGDFPSYTITLMKPLTASV